MSAEGRVENQKHGVVFGFQLDLREKNLITRPELPLFEMTLSHPRIMCDFGVKLIQLKMCQDVTDKRPFYRPPSFDPIIGWKYYCQQSNNTNLRIKC